MSTNYYFNINLDKEILCGSLELNEFLLRQVDTYIHIGKRSGGWLPLFKESMFYNSVEGIVDFYKRNEEYLTIEDDYGWEMSFEELEEELLEWDGGPAAKGNPRSHEELRGIYRDDAGYEFVSWEFF